MALPIVIREKMPRIVVDAFDAPCDDGCSTITEYRVRVGRRVVAREYVLDRAVARAKRMAELMP